MDQPKSTKQLLEEFDSKIKSSDMNNPEQLEELQKLSNILSERDKNSNTEERHKIADAKKLFTTTRELWNKILEQTKKANKLYTETHHAGESTRTNSIPENSTAIPIHAPKKAPVIKSKVTEPLHESLIVLDASLNALLNHPAYKLDIATTNRWHQNYEILKNDIERYCSSIDNHGPITKDLQKTLSGRCEKTISRFLDGINEEFKLGKNIPAEISKGATQSKNRFWKALEKVVESFNKFLESHHRKKMPGDLSATFSENMKLTQKRFEEIKKESENRPTTPQR